jgi:ectoine hydroxylase-related dioxygenase (phytanoyl-CoA dioxygenase family)
MPSRLTQDQLNSYNDEGYLLFKEPVFAPEKFSRLKNHFEEVLARWPSDKRPEAMDVPHFTDPALFEWLLADEVLDLVEPILGPDIALWSSHFICKPQGDGRKVPWHEDSAYWKGLLEPMEVVTVWLAIDPSSEENGCMYVIPHTHRTGKRGFSDYVEVDRSKNVFDREISREQVRMELARPCILEENEASLHDARLMHGSPPNTSSIRRCGYTMRYTSTRTVMNPDFHTVHKMFPARGKVIAHQPEAYGEPGQAYEAVMAERAKRPARSH